MAHLPDAFSRDYATAKARFYELSREAGGSLHVIGLDARSPENEALSIDIAWFGSARPRRVLIHSSGIHGVEGFAGSAIQLELLQQLPVIGVDDALILVHVLNPFGMSWLRRTDEANVDLNRNFVYLNGADAAGGTLDPAIDHLFNPRTPFGLKLFTARALLLIVRLGLSAIKQSVGQGQRENPRGLFYTGDGLQPGPTRYVEWLREHLAGTRHIFAIDVHTGLGRWGGESLFYESAERGAGRFAKVLGRKLIQDLRHSVGYETHGGLATAFRLLPHQPQLDYVTQEFGSYNPVRVLRALQRENYFHQHGDSDVLHPSKQYLRDIFCPPAERWRRAVLQHGVCLVQKAARFVFDQA